MSRKYPKRIYHCDGDVECPQDDVKYPNMRCIVLVDGNVLESSDLTAVRRLHLKTNTTLAAHKIDQMAESTETVVAFQSRLPLTRHWHSLQMTMGLKSCR